MLKLIFIFFLFSFFTSYSQKKELKKIPLDNTVDSLFFSKMKYRLVGPFRGGRSGAVAGDYKNRNTFYFGGTGGGVWKTTDGGSNWKNISDKYFGGSIGAVAVAPSDQNIIYVGEGENTLRGNVSEGLGGMWRSDDGGRTWNNIGLKDGRHIIRIVIHPRDPNTVWVAVMGHLFGPNNRRRKNLEENFVCKRSNRLQRFSNGAGKPHSFLRRHVACYSYAIQYGKWWRWQQLMEKC